MMNEQQIEEALRNQDVSKDLEAIRRAKEQIDPAKDYMGFVKLAQQIKEAI